MILIRLILQIISGPHIFAIRKSYSNNLAIPALIRTLRSRDFKVYNNNQTGLFEGVYIDPEIEFLL